MDNLMILFGVWVVAMTAAVVFLLFKVDDLAQSRGQMEVALRKLQESTNAFAAAVERAANRGRAVQKSKAPKGK